MMRLLLIRPLIMKRIFIPLSAALFACHVSAALADEAICKSGMHPLPAGYEGWSNPLPLNAATQAGSLPASKLTLGHASQIHLAHTPDVQFLQRPAEPGGSVSYSGMVIFEVIKDGTYRVMLPNKTWIDVVGGATLVSSIQHQHGPDCSGIRKMVDFSLKTGTYTLQLAGSGQQDIPVMVSAVP
ncbi:hypothetical protein FXF46_13500 [Gluconobacter thailandicus]|uniref:Homogentisate 1,2-dioxygenase n=2 Tax=Gluconobacter thailandicus TaxID=257438 RepID=A0AAP9ETK6_GLUTH|nr:hypothetical protein FXF46_13500 [Gluconobacter thailandicus]